jgi:hypothetical protein
MQSIFHRGTGFHVVLRLFVMRSRTGLALDVCRYLALQRCVINSVVKTSAESPRRTETDKDVAAGRPVRETVAAAGVGRNTEERAATQHTDGLVIDA